LVSILHALEMFLFHFIHTFQIMWVPMLDTRRRPILTSMITFNYIIFFIYHRCLCCVRCLCVRTS